MHFFATRVALAHSFGVRPPFAAKTCTKKVALSLAPLAQSRGTARSLPFARGCSTETRLEYVEEVLDHLPFLIGQLERVVDDLVDLGF